jgi:hypothetical protein
LLTLLLTIPAATVPSEAGQHDHHADVNQQGDAAMGFSHLKTTHHFILKPDGGLIEVTANDANDTKSRDQIRMHLSHIAMLFKAGDFSKPMMTHGQTPPGVPEMTRLKAEITYSFEEIERGGRLRIATGRPEALAAVHEFLRFQITEHQTGDPLQPETSKTP